MMKKLKMIILGYGQRGGIYGNYAFTYPEKYEVVAVVDCREARLEIAKEQFDCPVFKDYKSMLEANIEADFVAVATQDEQHEEHAIACMEKGYDLLLEKPISNSVEGCRHIYEVACKYDRKVIVCHVLRYSPFYKRVKEILESGELGEIITIHASENVGFYHQAHSFVRGPWRNKAQSSPMILAKCCHDMDIFRWLVGKKCKTVASMGGLRIFKKENAPEGSADFCSDCNVDCIYKAQKLYTDKDKCGFSAYFCNDNSSDEKILAALTHTQYDRCVFKCDNDVVDHQVSIMQFEDDITVNHTMTAFSKEIYRDIKIHGTKAELVGVMEKNYIEIRPFEGEVRTITWEDNISVGGHSGGDEGMMGDVYLAFNGQVTGGVTFIDVSLDSHLMSFAAEESRLQGGQVVEI